MFSPLPPPPSITPKAQTSQHSPCPLMLCHFSPFTKSPTNLPHSSPSLQLSFLKLPSRSVNHPSSHSTSLSTLSFPLTPFPLPPPSSSLRCQTSKRNNLISIQIYSGECKIFNTFPIFRLSCLFLAIIINLRMMHIKMQMSYCKNYSCFMQIIFCQLWNKRLRVKRYGINFCLHYLYGK